MPHIDANGIRLHYRIDGPDDGRPLLLSNSLASTLHMWDPQIADLTSAGFRVIRYDSRGHGRSDAPEGAYSIEMLAEDAVALRWAWDKQGGVLWIVKRRNGWPDAGGQAPGQGQQINLANTSAHMPTKDMWEGRVRTVAQGGMAAIADATIGRWFTPASQERLKEVIGEVREMILGTPPHGFIGCCRAIQSMDQRKTISGIETPTLVIVGAEDPATTPEHAREIHGAIKGARYIEIPDAAHLSNIEQPAAFTKAVRAFLDD